MGKLNLNFAKPQQISNLIKGIGITMSGSICQKRPYYDVEDVIKKNGEKFKKFKKELEQCSYIPYSFLNKLTV
jgi:hypothetical protein